MYFKTVFEQIRKVLEKMQKIWGLLAQKSDE